MTKKAQIIVKELPKSGTLETCNLYIKNAVVFYPVVHEPKLKYQSTDKEFSVTVFVDEESKDRLLDEVMVNKTFAEVGVTKTSKPPRKIKYMLSSQADEGKVNYDIVKGLWGFNVAKPEFSKKGNRMSVNVIGLEGKPFTENVGNGSVVNLKLFGYKNQDNQLVVTLDTMQVVEHVPFESKGAADSIQDDVFGVSYSVKKADKPVEAKEPPVAQQQAEDPLDSDIPFMRISDKLLMII